VTRAPLLSAPVECVPAVLAGRSLASGVGLVPRIVAWPACGNRGSPPVRRRNRRAWPKSWR